MPAPPKLLSIFYSRSISDDSLFPPQSAYVPVEGAECGPNTKRRLCIGIVRLAGGWMIRCEAMVAAVLFW